MTVYATPAALRAAFYPFGYPAGMISRIPDNADWLPNITGVGGQSQIQGFVGPIITTPGVTANGGQGYAFDAAGNMLFWDANGRLVPQADLPASSGAFSEAASMADAYDPASSHFGQPFPENGGIGQFESTLAVSVAGRMANLGESYTLASSNAAAAARRLGIGVIQAPAPTVTAPQSPAPTEPITAAPVVASGPSAPLNADRPAVVGSPSPVGAAVNVAPNAPVAVGASVQAGAAPSSPAPSSPASSSPAPTSPATGGGFQVKPWWWLILAAIAAAVVAVTHGSSK